MARHSQRQPVSQFVCTHCKAGNCEQCIDILRIPVDLDPICTCKFPGHSGEPNAVQILDPETGTVYAPGLEVSIDGEVKFHGRD